MAETKKKVDCRNKKFIFIGVGAVAKATILFLDDQFDIDYNNVYLIDEIDMREVAALQSVFKRGANFFRLSVKDEDFELLFKLLKVKPYDFVVDLTTNTNSYKMVETVRKHSLLYLNTSMEINWHFNADSSVYAESLYKRHVDIADINKKNPDTNNATHIYEMGMNPGLISHFTIRAVADIARLILEKKEDKELKTFLQNKDWAKICKHIGVEIAHCSEIDTQVAENIKADDKTFINTWSCIGLLEEGLEPVQLGWGTHEKTLPPKHEHMGPHQVGLKNPAYKQWHTSAVLDEEVQGMVIPHGEGVTLTETLSLPDYSPTIHYVYRLCKQTRDIMAKTPFEELQKVKNWRVLNPYEDKLTGEDRIGALLVLNHNPLTGEKKNWSYWCGSVLAQTDNKFIGPTIIQVAAGVIVGMRWAIENPTKGPNYSEAIDTDWAIEVAKPYLGKFISTPSTWSPKSTQFVDLTVNV